MGEDNNNSDSIHFCLHYFVSGFLSLCLGVLGNPRHTVLCGRPSSKHGFWQRTAQFWIFRLLVVAIHPFSWKLQSILSFSRRKRMNINFLVCLRLGRPRGCPTHKLRFSPHFSQRTPCLSLGQARLVLGLNRVRTCQKKSTCQKFMCQRTSV